MADVKLTLGLELDPKSLADAKESIDNAFKSSGGGSGGGATDATVKFKEFNDELSRIKTSMRDAETQFRKVSLAEKDLANSTDKSKDALQRLATAQNATKEAKEVALSTYRAESAALEALRARYSDYPQLLEKASVANKSLVEANQRVTVGFVGMASALQQIDSSIKASNNVLLEFGRGIQDASMFAVDFRLGMIAVGNNISQTAEAMGRMVTQAKAQADAIRNAGGSANAASLAFGALAKSFMGVNGLIFLLNIALTAIQFWPKRAKEAADGTDVFKDSVDRLSTALGAAVTQLTAASASAGAFGSSFSDLDKAEDSLNRINKAYAEQQALSAKIAKDREEFVRTQANTADAFQLDKSVVDATLKAYDAQIVKQARITGALGEQKQLLEAQVDVLRTVESVLGRSAEKSAEIAENFGVAQFRSQDMLRLFQAAQADIFEDENIKIPDVDVDLTSIYGTNPERLKRDLDAGRRIVQANQLAIIQDSSQYFSVRKDANEKYVNDEIDFLQKSADFQVLTEQEKAEKILRIKRDAANRSKAIDSEQFAALNQIVSLTSNVIGALGDLHQQRSNQLKEEARQATDPAIRARKEAAAKKEFETAKRYMIGQALMNTYLGTVSAYAQTPGGPVLKAIAGGLALAFGLLQVKRIRDTKFDISNNASGRGAGVSELPSSQDLKEGFRLDTIKPEMPSGGQTAFNNKSLPQNITPTIVINSQLNNEVLAYSVRKGEANIRVNTTIMQSDAS